MRLRAAPAPAPPHASAQPTSETRTGVFTLEDMTRVLHVLARNLDPAGLPRLPDAAAGLVYRARDLFPGNGDYNVEATVTPGVVPVVHLAVTPCTSP